MTNESGIPVNPFTGMVQDFSSMFQGIGSGLIAVALVTMLVFVSKRRI